MREIKFRAYDKTNKCWVYITVAENNYTLIFETTSGTTIGDLERWLQFTGLKDKNGKEIYEGDIVEHQIPSLGTDRKEIYWDKENYRWSMRGYEKYQGGLIDKMATFKVIGNVFENKNLLI